MDCGGRGLIEVDDREVECGGCDWCSEAALGECLCGCRVCTNEGTHCMSTPACWGIVDAPAGKAAEGSRMRTHSGEEPLSATERAEMERLGSQMAIRTSQEEKDRYAALKQRHEATK